MNNFHIIVPFHQQQLFIIEHNDEPYVPMRPIVENMGLDWKSQYTKLKQRFSGCVVEITTQMPTDIQRRAYTCLPLKKLFGWLMLIMPNKVKPEIKEQIIRYQNECDDVLWQHWSRKLSARQYAFEELNRLYLQETISKEKGSFHGVGLQKRKREKMQLNARIGECERRMQPMLELA